MTPQERIRLAKSLFKRAKSQPGITSKQRAEARRTTRNLVALNMLDATRKKPD